MQSDKGTAFIRLTDDVFSRTFSNNIKRVSECANYQHMGFYKLVYKYEPQNLIVEFESYQGVFDIYISDDEGARSSLYRIKKYNAETNESNIENAINLLKEELINDKLDLLVTKGSKVYKKKNGKLTRIRV